ncbi:hypothetical protein [Cupriavidus sp. H18C2]|uniref:hypothetical protein n=1 Tax=Cupriavidus sp. H18C2 TaxID=3241602 RepID=UPI003BF8D11E
MTELSTTYSFFSDEAFETVSSGRLAPVYVSEMMKALDTVRSVAAGTALVLRMGINIDVASGSDEAPALNRCDISILKTLCLVTQEMIEERAMKLIDDINLAASKPEASR